MPAGERKTTLLEARTYDQRIVWVQPEVGDRLQGRLDQASQLFICSEQALHLRVFLPHSKGSSPHEFPREAEVGSARQSEPDPGAVPGSPPVRVESSRAC